jgi:small subunit ribosomal protein S13
MIYLFESELPENKPVTIALTKIYGIGKNKSYIVSKKLGFSKTLNINCLEQDQINKLFKNIESFNIKLGSDLKKSKLLKLKKMLSIKSYKGLRRNQGLPTRGQRTHTNGRTSRKKF